MEIAEALTSLKAINTTVLTNCWTIGKVLRDLEDPGTPESNKAWRILAKELKVSKIFLKQCQRFYREVDAGSLEDYVEAGLNWKQLIRLLAKPLTPEQRKAFVEEIKVGRTNQTALVAAINAELAGIVSKLTTVIESNETLQCMEDFPKLLRRVSAVRATLDKVALALSAGLANAKGDQKVRMRAAQKGVKFVMNELFEEYTTWEALIEKKFNDVQDLNK